MSRRIVKKLLYILLFGAAALGLYTFVSGITDSSKRSGIWKGLVNNMNMDVGMDHQDSASEQNKVSKPQTGKIHAELGEISLNIPRIRKPVNVMGKNENKDDARREDEDEKEEKDDNRAKDEKEERDGNRAKDEKENLDIRDDNGDVIEQQLFPFGMSKKDIEKYKHHIDKESSNENVDDAKENDDDNNKVETDDNKKVETDDNSDADDEDQDDQEKRQKVVADKHVEIITDRPNPDSVIRDEEEQVIEHRLAPFGVRRAHRANQHAPMPRQLQRSINNPTKSPNGDHVRPDAAFFDDKGYVKTKGDSNINILADFQQRMGLGNAFAKSKIGMRNPFLQQHKILRPLGSHGRNPALENSDQEDQKPKDAFEDILKDDKGWGGRNAPGGSAKRVQNQQLPNGNSAGRNQPGSWNDFSNERIVGNNANQRLSNLNGGQAPNWNEQEYNRNLNGNMNQQVGDRKRLGQKFPDQNGNMPNNNGDVFKDIWKKQKEHGHQSQSSNGGFPQGAQIGGNQFMGNNENAGHEMYRNQQQWPNQRMPQQRIGGNGQGLGEFHGQADRNGNQDSRVGQRNGNGIDTHAQKFLGQSFFNQLKRERVDDFLDSNANNQAEKAKDDPEKPKEKSQLLIEDLTRPLEIQVDCIVFQYPSGEGSLCIHPATRSDYIEKTGESGTWEPGAMKQFAEILASDPSMGVIDVGAGIGPYTIAAALTGRRVVSVEPLRANYRLLHKSALENNVADKITMVTQALDKESYTGHMLYSKEPGGYDNVKIEQLKRPSDTLNDPQNNVQVTTLDSLVPVIQFPNALLKMDVGGMMEADIMQSGSLLFSKVNIPFIMTHWNNGISFTKKVEIVTKLGALHYKPKRQWDGPVLATSKLHSAIDYIIWQKQG